MTLEEIRAQYPEYTDLSDQELADKLYNSSYSDMDRNEFNQKIGFNPNPPPPEPEKDFGDTVMDIASDAGEAIANYDYTNLPSDVGGHLWENKFAYTLGALGMLGGPWTAAATSAIGTGIDAATSDEDRKWGEEMLLSAGIDAAVLATLKIPPALWRGIAAKIKGGGDPREIVESLTKDATEDIGTKAAARQSQQIAQAVGGTLTLGQAGKRGGLDEIMEGISFTGILSAQTHKANLNKIADFSRRAMQNLFNANQTGITAAHLGDTIHSNLKTARTALIETHGNSLAQIGKEFGKDHNVDLSQIGKALNKWDGKKKYTKAVGVDGSIVNPSKLEPQTQRVLKELQSEWGQMKKGSAMSYVDFSIALNKKISSLSDFKQQATYAPAAVRELTKLSNYMRHVAHKELKKANPKAAAKFREAQKNYATATTRLFPEINDTFIQSVGPDGAYQLGDMVTQMHNVENVQALYKSLDAAYKATNKSQRASLAIKSPEGVKQLIRRRYLEQTFPKSKNLEELDFTEFQKMALRLSNPDEAALAKEVLGAKEFNGFKAIVNTLAKASETPGSNFASLAIRGKEIGAATVLGSAVVGGGIVTGGTSAVIGGIGILYTPKILSHIVSNPRRVNKFLGLKNKTNKKELMESASVLINDVWKEMPEEDREELKKKAEEAMLRPVQNALKHI